MATPAQITALTFAIFGILSFVRWWAMGFKKTKYPLWIFVLMIACVWTIILFIAWFTGGQSDFDRFWTIARVYGIGMLVMFIGMKASKS